MLPTLTLGDWGSRASIVSLPISLWTLGVSVYVALKVRDVRQRLLFMVMADRRLGRLRKQVQDLDEQMQGSPIDWIIVDRLVRQICADIARFRRSVSPEADNVAERLAKLNRRFDKIGGSSLRHDEGEKAELVLKMLDEMMVFVSHSADDVEERRVGGFDDES